MIKQCRKCGNDFAPSIGKIKKHNWICRECEIKIYRQKHPIEKGVCNGCGIEFQKKDKRQSYCNKRCQSHYMYIKHKQKRNLNSRNWIIKNRMRRSEIQRKYSAKESSKIKRRISSKNARIALSFAYMANKLRRNGIKEITPHLIELKRKTIKLKRLLYEHQQTAQVA